jgi:hypothetical protein
MGMTNKIAKSQVSTTMRTLLTSVIDCDSSRPFDFDAEQAIADMLAYDIQDDIDWEVLSKLIDTSNWIEIRLSKDTKKIGKRIVRKWVQQTFKNGVFVFSDRVMFAREEDAVLFALRWS